ncbi:hypothetical protein RB598_000193 [Gaeumannomyces tritici]
MANTPEPGASRVSVNDITWMRPVDLAAYIRKHLGPTDDFDLLDHRRHQLPLCERNKLAERLIHALAENRYSRPLDLDDLDARLQKALSGGPNALPRVSRPRPPRSGSPTLGGIELAECGLQIGRMEEADAYDQLVKDSGRPLYPIELLDDVSASFPRGPIRGPMGDLYYVTGNPDRYQELLRPWLDDIATGGYFNRWSGGTWTDYPWGVFQKQWKRWTMFRGWQKDNRDLKDDGGGFPEYVEAEKRYIKREYSERVAADELAELEANPLRLKQRWEGEQRRRKWQRHYCYESGVKEFSDYVDAVKRRLARHGFTRPFELSQDPKQQGKLETWIEYLCFEYWWLDLFTRAIERRQQKRDENEEDMAREALERSQQNAKRIYIETQLDQRRLSIPKPERIRRLQRGNREMLAAESRLEGLKRRSALIKEFKPLSKCLKAAKRDVARHRILLPWILDQIPLIEAELSRGEAAGGLDGTRVSKTIKSGLDGTRASKTIKSGLDGTRASSKTIKRRLDDSDSDDSPRQTSTEKRRRLSPRPSNGTVVLDSEIQQKEPVPSIVGGIEETLPPEEQQCSRTRAPPVGHSRRIRAAREAASRGLRRSPRIAARLTSLKRPEEC